MLVGSGEPPALSALGLHSPLCDQLGADFVLLGRDGIASVQRKEVSDLVASLRDGRLADFFNRRTKEVAWAILVVEGSFDWDHTGQSRRCRGFTKAQYDGVRWATQYEHGTFVQETESMEATAAFLTNLEFWLAAHEAQKSSLLVTPKGETWGDPVRATGLRVLQQVPNVSLGKANLIYNAVGLPLSLTVSAKELQQIRGIGPVIAKAMEETFNGGTLVDATRTEPDPVLADTNGATATAPRGDR